MERVEFEWPGNPMTWKRANTSGNRRTSDPAMRQRKKQLKEHVSLIRPKAWPVMSDSAAYALKIVICKRSKWRIYPGDVDNFSKLIMDAMEGVLYPNDKQVVDQHTRKIIGEKPFTWVCFEQIDPMASNCHFGKEKVDE